MTDATAGLRPTRTSTALATTVATATAVLLLWQVRSVAVPTAIGVAGVVCLAVGLGLVGSDQRPLPAVLASLLLVPVAAGILVGTLGVTLTILRDFFPVAATAQIPGRSLHLLARVGVAVGCLLAVLGVALGVRNVVDTDSVEAYLGLALRTSVVPLVVGGALVVGTVFTRATGDPLGPVRGVVPWLLSPGTGGTHLATLLGLLTVAAFGVRAALDALPIAEFLSDRGSARTDTTQLDSVLSALGVLTAAATMGTLFALAVETALGGRLQQVIGSGLYRVLIGVSTASALRLGLLGAVVLSGSVVVAVALLRRLAQLSVGSSSRWVGPFVGGSTLTAAGVVAGEPLVDALVVRIAARLPGPPATLFRETTGSVVRFYGPATVAVALVTVLVAATASAILFLRLLLLSGYLTEETAGYSLASGGLFAAAAFTGAAGFEPVLAFAGLVAALFVWDVGRYGTLLGREVGRHAPTREAELVHAGGTLAVGLGGALIALGLVRVEPGAGGSAVPAALVLVGALAGLVFLVAALR